MNREDKERLLRRFLNLQESNAVFNIVMSNDSIIKKFLDNEEAEAKAYEEILAAEAFEYRREARILKAIKKLKGRTFYRQLREILDDSTNYSFSIAKAPKGEYVKNDNNRSLPGYWVHQYRNGGYEGDSFAGVMSIQLKPNRWLQFHYSM